jgi:hypothetical protein
MKRLYSILLFANLVLTSFAQELPEVPLKNGLAYYKFDHKLENTNNKCVSSYFNIVSHPTFVSKYMAYAGQLSQAKNSIHGHYNLFLLLNDDNDNNNINCLDTISTQNQGFHLTISGDIDFSPAIIQLMKKKIIENNIYASVQIVFTSKTEYSIYLKNVNCNLAWVQGFKTGTDIYDLGELYTQVKNSGKISKKDVKFFEELNYFIQSTDEIILKSLVETIKLDQL